MAVSGNNSTERSKKFYKKLNELGGKRLIVNLPSNAVESMLIIMNTLSLNQTEAIRHALIESASRLTKGTTK